MSHREGPDSPLSSYPSHKGPLPSPTHSSGLQRHPRSSEGLRAGSAKPQSSPAGHQSVTQCGSGSSRHKRQGDGPEASTFYTAVPSSTTRALLQQTYSKPRSHVGCSSRVHEPREAGPAGSSFYIPLAPSLPLPTCESAERQSRDCREEARCGGEATHCGTPEFFQQVLSSCPAASSLLPLFPALYMNTGPCVHSPDAQAPRSSRPGPASSPVH